MGFCCCNSPVSVPVPAEEGPEGHPTNASAGWEIVHECRAESVRADAEHRAEEPAAAEGQAGDQGDGDQADNDG